MKMEQTECSEKSAYKIQKPGNYPEENIQREVFIFRLIFGVLPALQEFVTCLNSEESFPLLLFYYYCMLF
jgi:hypothetical protein